MAEDTYAFYFDRYQRYAAAAERLRELAPSEEAAPLTVLDVGGHDHSFAAFVPEHRVGDFSGRIEPGSPAPHDDASVDVVVALDVLEHVAPDARPFFIDELARVAARGVILSVPVKQAADTERFVLELTGSAWLAEHQQYGLPEPAEVEALLDGAGLAWDKRPNASLPSWMAMMLLMHGVDKPLRLSISEFFNRHFYEVENREPAYRYVYTGVKSAGPNA